MLQGAPPCVKHRIRDPQLCEGEAPAQNACREELVDLGVDRRERVDDAPGQNASREVVIHGVEVGACRRAGG